MLNGRRFSVLEAKTKKFWRLDVQKSMSVNTLMNCTLKIVKIVNFISAPCVYICAQLCLTLCDPIDLPGSSVHGIFQARILGWIAISSSRGSSQPRNQNCVSCISCIDRFFFFFYQLHLWEALSLLKIILKIFLKIFPMIHTKIPL